MSVSLLPITIVPVEMFHENDHRIQISHSLIQYWNLDIKLPYTINICRKNIEVQIEGANITKDEIFFSEKLFEHCLLPIQETRLIASYSKKDHSITFGPIIGLLTDLNDTENEPNFRSVHTFCEELHHVISNIGGFFYVFHLKDFSEGQIKAYCYQADQWVKYDVPMPDVIYNRIHSRKLEASSTFQKLKDTLNKYGIPIFNDRFLSKEEVHQLLYSEDHMQPYLPESIIASEESLTRMMRIYDSIYLKPIHGSQGRNIIRISKDGEEIWAEASTGKRKDETLKFESPSLFLNWLKPQLKKNIYLAQQSIPLMSYKNRHLDFRILCHKNFQGSWKATSAVARISAEKQFVSNIARGGEILKPLNVLSALSNQKTAIQQYALMKELAVETSSIISQKTNGLIGELGIDIGVDKDGKLWIIEANSKPSKNFEDDSKKIRPSAKALIEYCTSVTFTSLAAKEESKDGFFGIHNTK